MLFADSRSNHSKQVMSTIKYTLRMSLKYNLNRQYQCWKQLFHSAGNSTSNSTAPPVHCSRLLASIASSGINQECAIHDDCMGACCQLELLAHKMAYNFSVKPCETPSVRVEFNITDIEGIVIFSHFQDPVRTFYD